DARVVLRGQPRPDQGRDGGDGAARGDRPPAAGDGRAEDARARPQRLRPVRATGGSLNLRPNRRLNFRSLLSSPIFPAPCPILRQAQDRLSAPPSNASPASPPTASTV